MKKLTTLITAALLGVLAANAVPAKRVFSTFTQPDGTTVTAMLVGDEYGHYFITRDGTAMTRAEDGFLRPASAETLSALRQQASDRRMSRKSSESSPASRADASTGSIYHGLGHFSDDFPRNGKVKILVFLVEYTDVRFKTPNPQNYFSRQLNEVDFSDDKATGSARDYFIAQSGGTFDPEFVVLGPVRLSKNMAFYGGNDRSGYDKAPEQMVIEAVRAMDGQINYSEYDFNNDGMIDNVFVIYAGYGEADYRGSNYEDTVWPHNFAINNGGTYDGKRLFGYTCSNEMGGDNVINGIGTFVHEFSHVLGLPDLYNTEDSYDVTTPSEYDVMDYGPYLNNGRTPPNYSGVERNAMGWMYPAEFLGPQSYSIETIGKSNEAYIIPTHKNNEFFMVENRQREGWDKYLPGHGMLIWHVTFNQYVWDSNSPSNSKPVGVDLVEAGGTANSMDYDLLDSYPFPGSSRVTSFTPDTRPALKANDGSRIDFPITDITEANGIISFDVLGGLLEFPVPDAPTLNATNTGTLEISWAAIEKAKDYQLTVTCEGKPFEQYTDYSVGNVTKHTIEGIDGELDYAVSLRAVNGNVFSEYSPEANITAPVVDFIYRMVKNVTATANSSTATLAWNALTDAVDYALTLEYLTETGSSNETHDFGSNDKLMIPSDWDWNGTSLDTYRSTAANFIGNSAPSLKFAKNERMLTSAVFSSEITKVNFWMVGAGVTDDSESSFELQVRPDTNSEWTTIYTIDKIRQYNGKGQVFETDVPSGMYQLRFVYNKDIGNVGLDDVTVTTANRTYNKVMDRQNVGNVLTYKVNIPAGSSAFRFFVEGINGDRLYSRPSNTTMVKITSAVEDIPADIMLQISGNTVTYHGSPGMQLQAFGLTGIILAQAITDASGTASITLPSAGIYIIVTPTGAHKVIIK